MKKRNSAKKNKPRERTNKSKTENKAHPGQSIIKEWVNSLVFAFVAMLFVHTFIFQPFVVPTPSMASTVLPGDYLIVSKLHYGAMTPRTIGIPYTDLYFEGIELPAFRFPGFSAVKRGDVVVFNFPPETEHPIDKRQPYLKRAIGLPGEEIEIRNKKVFINGSEISDYEGQQQLWQVFKTDARVNLPFQKLKEIGVEEILNTPNPLQLRVFASKEVAAEIASWPYVEKVESFISDGRNTRTQLFPSTVTQSTDNYKSLRIPKAGATIALSPETWAIYGDLIHNHEPNTVVLETNGTFSVNEKPTSHYTFAQDYYFMMGDNRDNSLDSRFWGFVPESHIMGKAVARFYSWDEDAGWPRFERMFGRIR